MTQCGIVDISIESYENDKRLADISGIYMLFTVLCDKNSTHHWQQDIDDILWFSPLKIWDNSLSRDRKKGIKNKKLKDAEKNGEKKYT